MTRSVASLRPGEEVLADWPAGVPTKGGQGVRRGGRLHLTTQRLVWVPLEIEVMVPVGDVVVPASAGGGEGWETELAAIMEVVADLGRRATIVLTTPSGVVRYLVQASRATPLWSRKNQRACDDAVERIRAVREA
jgi:hypothetical protein